MNELKTKPKAKPVKDLTGARIKVGDWLVVLAHDSTPTIVASGQVSEIHQYHDVALNSPLVSLKGNIACFNPALCLKVDLEEAVAADQLTDLVPADVLARLPEIVAGTFEHYPF